jgi:hypothetical protein
MKSSGASSCAINKRKSRYSYTCLDKETIKEILREYNKWGPGNAVLPVSGTKFELYKLLKAIAGVGTKDTDLWTLKFIKDKELKLKLEKFTFKAKGPVGKWGWLSNYDITDTMNQYSLAYTKSKPFHYFGTFPSDHFQLNPHELVRLIALARRIPVGLVLNTDATKQPGQHWVSAFITRTRDAGYNDPNGDGDENEDRTVHGDDVHIYYFDSLRSKPNKNIEKFLSNFENLTIHRTDILQKKDGVCGLYAICFLLTKINEFYGNGTGSGSSTPRRSCLVLGDSKLNSMRRKIFRPR